MLRKSRPSLTALATLLLAALLPLGTAQAQAISQRIQIK